MTTDALTREFLEVELALVDDPDLPSRTQMDDGKLDELVESIRLVGLQQPMVLARVGDRFEVIAGHRRRIACTRAGLVRVPAMVYPSKDIPRRVIQAHENTKREALNPADEAVWFVELLEQDCGGDIEKLCGLVGEKLSYIDNRISLFRGDPQVFAALQAGSIKIGVAHELNKCPDEKYRRYYLDCAIRGGATHTTVAGWLVEWKQNFQGIPQAPAPAVVESPGMAAAAPNYFTCKICGRSDNVHLMRPVQIHMHCEMAILDPILEGQRGGT